METKTNKLNITNHGKIGSGGNATVYHVKVNGMDMAAKVHKNGKFDEEEKFISTFLKHENIVRTYSTIILPNGLEALLMEKASCDLLTVLNNKPFGVDLAISFAIDIAKGMACMHNIGTIHRDLKIDNILVFVENGRAVCKVSDLGHARRGVLDTTKLGEHDGIGTPGYMAPELKEKKLYTRSIDMFTYGIILVKLLRTAEHGQTLVSMYGLALSCLMTDYKGRIASFDDILKNLDRISKAYNAPARNWDVSPEVVRLKVEQTKIVRTLSEDLRRSCTAIIEKIAQ